MATIDESIEAELESKSIEKVPTITQEIVEVDEEVVSKKTEKPKKSRKIRSQAQIEAFEKARVKRAENYEKRKLLKEAEKQQKKEVKTKITEEINKLTTEEIKEKISKKVATPNPKSLPRQSTVQNNNPQPSVVNNYYYNVPHEDYKPPRRKKQVHYEDESSDEELKHKPKAKPKKVNYEPEPQPEPVKQTETLAPTSNRRVLKYNFV